MPLRLRVNAKPTLTQLSREIQAVADEHHRANELRSNGRTLYIKLRSACCGTTRESSRNEHRRRAVALVGAGLAAELTRFGASELADHLMQQFLPAAGNGRAAPVRIADVLDLQRVVDRARELPASVPGPSAVKAAADFVLRTRSLRRPGDPAPARHEITPSWSLSKSQVPSQSLVTPQTRTRASASLSAMLPPPSSLDERAAEFLAQAERATQWPVPKAGATDSRRVLPDGFLARAASFTVDDLLSPTELLRHEVFMAQARPLMTRVAPLWRAMLPADMVEVIEQLIGMHRVAYGYESVDVHFARDAGEAAILSPDGARVQVPVGRTEIVDNFDEFVHQLVYGLALRYQHHLARQGPRAAADDRPLALIMRASQRLPLEPRPLVEQFGMQRAAARQAWLASPSRRHANALADLVAAHAFASLPDDVSRLPRMARQGRHR